MPEFRKLKLIISDLLDYGHMHGVREATVSFRILDHLSEATMQFQMAQKPHDLEETFEKLNSPRQPEIEDYYEDLLGLDDDQLNIDVISAMIDDASYTYDNNILTIKIKRLF